MNEKFYQYIKNKFSVVETEIWDFSNGDNRIVDPALPINYIIGTGIYPVPIGFCSNQWYFPFVLFNEINHLLPSPIFKRPTSAYNKVLWEITTFRLKEIEMHIPTFIL